MNAPNRLVKSFTLEPDVSEYVVRTKGKGSASERVNQLLKRAMVQEQHDKLAAEAEAFFGSEKDAERKESRALQAASVRAITRD